MLVSCARCGKVHERNKCSIKKRKKSKSRTDEQKFRSSASWQRCAEIVRHRDSNLCAACLHEDPPIYRGDPLEVHHIVPIHDAWDLRMDPDNGITLCVDHHRMAEVGMISRATLNQWVREANERDQSI